MKPIAHVFLPVLLGVIAAWMPKGADAAAIRSLNDLPRDWSGVAGDLFHRGDARLKLGQAVERSRKVTGTYTQVEYELQGTLDLAGKSYSIQAAKLMLTAGYEQRAEVLWYLSDPLVPNLLTVARYDEKLGAFQLFESVEGRRGERRFALQGTTVN